MSGGRLNLAVVGATGMVGKEFIKILQERHFPVEELRLFASQRSAGETILFGGKNLIVSDLSPGCFKGVDVAFFSAGNPISKEWGPRAVEEGTFVIDNSSAFRMDPAISLVVPEVNANRIPPREKPAIIANPNCSTIQLVVALKPLHDAFVLKDVTVSTYQAVSGAGKEAVDELKLQAPQHLRGEKETPSVFPHPIAFNNIPHIDKFGDNGFTYEEMKVINETRKILELPNLPVSCTAVRTPTLNSHSEAVWVDFEKTASKEKIFEILKKAPGVILTDDPSNNVYPLNREATGRDEVFVGRIRKDPHYPNRWLLWVVSDNIRKGAALNGIQIAEKLFDL